MQKNVENIVSTTGITQIFISFYNNLISIRAEHSKIMFDVFISQTFGVSFIVNLIYNFRGRVGKKHQTNIINLLVAELLNHTIILSVSLLGYAVNMIFQAT